MASDKMLKALVLELMEGFDTTEESVSKLKEELGHIKRAMPLIEKLDERFDSMAITLAKIEGQLSGTKVNVNVEQKTDTNIGEVKGDANIEQHGN